MTCRVSGISHLPVLYRASPCVLRHWGSSCEQYASRYPASRRFLCAAPAEEYVSEEISSVDDIGPGLCPQEIWSLAGVLQHAHGKDRH